MQSKKLTKIGTRILRHYTIYSTRLVNFLPKLDLIALLQTVFTGIETQAK